MSERQRKHYRISSAVFKEAWLLRKRTMLFYLRFSSALKLAWKTVRCMARMHYSKVYGTTFNNRQAFLRQLAGYQESEIILTFSREPDNPFDTNAVQIIAHVKNKRSMVVGYLSKAIAAVVAPTLDEGKLPVVLFQGITGLRSNHFLGCNFKFCLVEK